MKIILALMGSLCLLACSKSPARPQAGSDGQKAIERAIEMRSVDWPALPGVIATTDGEIYLGNLNSQIETIETQPQLQRQVRFQVALAGFLYQRFQIEGRLPDAVRARDLLLSTASSPGFGPEDRLVLAQVLMGFHEFDAAAVQFAVAEAAGVDPARLSSASVTMQQARSLPAADHEPDTPAPGDYQAAVRSAAGQLNRGAPDAASALLRQAQDLYADVSPLPLAWIHTQQGIVFLRHGRYAQARDFFQAAHERFPQYFLAAEHLAETEALLGNHARSAALYRQVTAQNDQPGFWHGLAQAEAALGNEAAARAAERRAREGYARLLADHPLMYADHAVAYYLDTGDASEALRLARLNYAHRQDLSARLALAEALAGAGHSAEACEQVRSIQASGLNPPEISVSGGLLSDCT